MDSVHETAVSNDAIQKEQINNNAPNKKPSQHTIDRSPNYDMDVPIGAMANDDEDWTCQLHGGYSYWDDGGHLMLEANGKSSLIHDTGEQEAGESGDESRNG